MIKTVKIIKNYGSKKYYFWKDPDETVSENSHLMVADNEIVMLVHDKKVYQKFEEGTYVLDREQFPYLEKMIDQNGNISCIFFFYNKSMLHNKNFSIEKSAEYVDRTSEEKYNLLFKINYGLEIMNPVGFIENFVQNDMEYFSQTALEDFIKMYIELNLGIKIKEIFNRCTKEIQELPDELNSIGNELKTIINKNLDKYGFGTEYIDIEEIVVNPAK